MSKQYGLILPGQQKKAPVKPLQPPTKPSIFEESSGSESEGDKNAPQMRSKGTAGVSSGPSLMERRVARKLHEQALEEDPTIFQYDELYDEMDKGREEQKQTKSKEPKKPKYINKLMEHAERRKLEKELRIERQVQKDRDAEGEKFKDKDTYVTAAYRKKLESIRQLQEQEQRDEYLEAIGDVTKQKDLDGFYRHLYEQKLGTASEVIKPKTAPSTEEVSYKPIKPEAPKNRSYRQRRPSEGEEPSPKDKDDSAAPTSDETKPVQAHLSNNIDADSDFSIDDSSDEEEEKKEKEPEEGKKSKDKERKKKDLSKKPKEKSEAEKEEKGTPEPKKESNSDSEEDDPKDLPVPIVTKPPMDRTLVWRKRTVGEVFEAAVARYQERKRSRQG
ncbi:uncharacterized protein Dana_GF19403 [Drosophila ananassae]|uniref:Nuclear speckle splicing regulatory protein 1 N-terminal domain-containing protein n=1 Tax=Drosophila ananassae TaxID=7217 RepID=B3MXP5_DROAN|nr:nuclear speckle splicing regulatory protein 1 [Drosophila ananassae]EDV38510.1 uncharacterized protein Dana_GF19403 [Drosophila ananassae]